ncbi:MAG: methyltransferase domain-containing protein [Ignavibacteriae bacterium]|nr:methyltransferase domain-containing protein [Ignavibacteriota bacterium]
MKCRLCNSNCTQLFTAKVLSKYDVKYFSCPNCFLVQTEDPYWLEEAYANPINSTDIGLLNRNIEFAEKAKILIYFFFNKEGKFLDYAGGYGVFTRLMRDIGFDFYWQDPFTKNLFAKNFEYDESQSSIELVTTFESFEHFVNPIEEISKILKFSKNIIFSTNVIPKPIPKPNDWWYYGLEHGQHVSFYSKKTFKFIAKEFGLNFYSCSKTLHLFTDKKINKNYYDFVFKKSKYFSKHINKKLNSKTFSDSRMMIKNN